MRIVEGEMNRLHPTPQHPNGGACHYVLCMCMWVCVCARACVYPASNSVTKTSLDELDLQSTGPRDSLRNGQAPVRDSHPWHHKTSIPAIPHRDTRFHKHM